MFCLYYRYYICYVYFFYYGYVCIYIDLELLPPRLSLSKIRSIIFWDTVFYSHECFSCPFWSSQPIDLLRGPNFNGWCDPLAETEICFAFSHNATHQVLTSSKQSVMASRFCVLNPDWWPNSSKFVLLVELAVFLCVAERLMFTK